MRCSGCGKDIPFNGHVCPYCQRDKGADQGAHVAMTIGMIIGAGLGYLIFGFIGMLICGFVGGLIAACATLPNAQRRAKRPPKVTPVQSKPTAARVSPPKPPAVLGADAGSSVEDRLKRLHVLLLSGSINQEEHAAQRKAIIASL